MEQVECKIYLFSDVFIFTSRIDPSKTKYFRKNNSSKNALGRQGKMGKAIRVYKYILPILDASIFPSKIAPNVLNQLIYSEIQYIYIVTSSCPTYDIDRHVYFSKIKKHVYFSLNNSTYLKNNNYLWQIIIFFLQMLLLLA